MHGVELFERGADAQRPVNLRRGHRKADFWQPLAQPVEAQVAVGVNVHRAPMADTSMVST